MRYPLPMDTANVLKESVSQNQNLGLALDRLLPINDELSKDRKPWPKPEDKWKLTEESKSRLKVPLGFGVPLPTLISRITARRTAMFKSLSGYSVLVLPPAEVDYRMVVGFGTEHVLETNLCLHRIFGVPIIPGSAVKGVTRAKAFWDLADQLGVPPFSSEEAEQRRSEKKRTPVEKLDRLLSEDRLTKQESTLRDLQQDEACGVAARLRSLTLEQWQSLACIFYRTFGTMGRRGEVIFFDGCPLEPPKLKLDVLNPHYGDYYRNPKKPGAGEILAPPADYLNPVPTYFLTVDRGSRFQLALASKDPDLIEPARRWLVLALAESGIGGKTSAGYGFFQQHA